MRAGRLAPALDLCANPTPGLQRSQLARMRGRAASGSAGCYGAGAWGAQPLFMAKRSCLCLSLSSHSFHAAARRSHTRGMQPGSSHTRGMQPGSSKTRGMQPGGPAAAAAGRQSSSNRVCGQQHAAARLATYRQPCRQSSRAERSMQQQSLLRLRLVEEVGGKVKRIFALEIVLCEREGGSFWRESDSFLSQNWEPNVKNFGKTLDSLSN